MLKYKVKSEDVGKTISYQTKTGRTYNQPVIGINTEENVFIVFGEAPYDYPIRISPKYVKSIN